MRKYELLDDDHLTLGQSKLFFTCGLIRRDNVSQLQLLPRFILELFKVYFYNNMDVINLISTVSSANSFAPRFSISTFALPSKNL